MYGCVFGLTPHFSKQVDKDKVASIIALALRKQEGTSPVNSQSGTLSQDWSNDPDRRSKTSLSTGSFTGLGKSYHYIAFEIT